MIARRFKRLLNVSVKQLADDFARYLYLPRLRDSDVLLDAIKDGVALLSWSQDTFAYAEGWDEHSHRYRGLQTGRQIRVSMESGGVVVKPEVATHQKAAEEHETGRGDGKVQMLVESWVKPRSMEAR